MYIYIHQPCLSIKTQEYLLMGFYHAIDQSLLL